MKLASGSKSNLSNSRRNDEELGNSMFPNPDQVSRQLLILKSKYLNKKPTITQKGLENLYKKRRAVVRPLEIFSEPSLEDNVERLRCWVQGVRIEGALTAKARFSQ
jgi:hypothetical protein